MYAYAFAQNETKNRNGKTVRNERKKKKKFYVYMYVKRTFADVENKIAKSPHRNQSFKNSYIDSKRDTPCVHLTINNILRYNDDDVDDTHCRKQRTVRKE